MCEPRIIVEIKGGMVTGVYSDVKAVNVSVLDWDERDCETCRDELEEEIEHLVSVY